VDDRKNRGNPALSPAHYVISDIIGGGMNEIDTYGENCAILSAKIMEQMSPLRVLRSEFIPDSGGLGTRQDY